MRMSAFGGFWKLSFRFARPSTHSDAKRRTSAFCCSVPSRNAIEMVSPDTHLLSLTSAAFVLPVLGAGALNHAKHHFLSSAMFHSYTLPQKSRRLTCNRRLIKRVSRKRVMTLLPRRCSRAQRAAISASPIETQNGTTCYLIECAL